MGIAPTNKTDFDDASGAYAVTRRQAITVYRGNASPERLESILAHELVHVFQVNRELGEELQFRGTAVNRRLLSRAVVEGTAEYAQVAYGRRFLNRSNGETNRTAWRNADPYTRFSLAPYYHGYRYVDRRISDPSELDRIYGDPPRSTEQILHGYAPEEELPRPLAVDANASGTDWHVDGRTTKGELFARIALSTELGYNRSVAAAAGWGADRLLTLDHPNATGYAWTLRWDSTADADEFESAMRAFAANRTDPAFDVARVSDGTTVVLAGPSCFVDGTSVDGGDANVTVRAGGC